MQHPWKQALLGTLLALGIQPAALAANPAPSAGKSVQTLLETKILFDAQGKAAVTYQNQGQSEADTVNNKIQSALILYAYAMKQSDEAAGKSLLNQVQKVVSQVATEQGLKRAEILAGNPLVKPAGVEPANKGFQVVFRKEPGVGNTLEVTPIAGGEKLVGSAVFYYFQDLVQNLPENGLRLMILAAGGMNKWYREVGKASDANSVSQAPSYGLNLAVDILGKLSGQKI